MMMMHPEGVAAIAPIGNFPSRPSNRRPDSLSCSFHGGCMVNITSWLDRQLA